MEEGELMMMAVIFLAEAAEWKLEVEMPLRGFTNKKETALQEMSLYFLADKQTSRITREIAKFNICKIFLLFFLCHITTGNLCSTINFGIIK